MPRCLIAAFALVFCVTLPAVAEDDHRQLGAHEHGHATLNIALDGSRLVLELLAPGMDIVGFEHMATSDADREAEAKARTILQEPARLFKLPVAAGCTPAGPVKVRVEADHDEDEGKPGAAAPGTSAEGHAQYRAAYAFECATAASLTGIEFPYFGAFPATREIDVNVIGPKGQSRFEVSRDKPRMDLGGIM